MRVKEKERAEKQKARNREQKPLRATFLLPVDLQQVIARIAGWKSVSESQVVTFLLYEAVRLYDAGEISFNGCIHQSRSPRQNGVLIHPEDAERVKKFGGRPKIL